MEEEPAPAPAPGPGSAKKKRSSYPSAEQKRRLVELLNSDQELRSGKFSATFTKKVAQERWGAIALELNAIGGASKTLEEWRKTYQDKKSAVKKKASAVGSSARATGGGQPGEQLTDDDLIIMSTMSQESIHGHSAWTEESAVPSFSQDIFNETSFSGHSLADVEDTDTVGHNETEAHGSNEPQPQSSTTAQAETVEATNTAASTQGLQERTHGRPRQTRGGRQNSLQRSLDVAAQLVTELRSKNESEEAFRRDVLTELKRFSASMESIKDSFQTIASSLADKNHNL